jgi:DNA invertase Pin-like site-specific DNA recombinase
MSQNKEAVGDPVRPSKVTSAHLRRQAYVYIRQSTLQQVAHNRESQVNQRQMAGRAVALGWSVQQIEVIDEDQGLSGRASTHRSGFQRLLAEVSLGQVGIIIGYEVSRLARSNGDWYHLLDLAALFDTLLADNDGVYNPRLFNDRLLLGLKGTMSEAELHLLRQRLEAGRLRQIERGTYRQQLPTGLIRLSDGSVAKDPDEQIQRSIALVLAKFAELGSCGQVLRYWRREELSLARLQMRGPDKGTVMWKPATHTAIYDIVRNPAYAGAFVYGRKQQDPQRRQAGRPGSGRVWQPQAAWSHIQQNVYPAYITWEQYQANQTRLKENAVQFCGTRQQTPGVAREGPALLQGLAVCGHCGYRRQMNYKPHGYYYQCRGLSKNHGTAACPTIHGLTVDQAVVQAFFAALRPAHLDTLEAVLAAQQAEQRQLEGQWAARVQRAEYEAQRAQRQYMQVEPENRLVAAELERRWEEKLGQLHGVQEAASRWRQRTPSPLQLTDEIREQLAHLSERLPEVWPHLTSAQQKKLLRSLIDSVILKREAADRVSVRIVWVSGHYSDRQVRVPVQAQTAVSGYADMVQRIGELYEQGLDDAQIAARLSQEGFRSARRSDVALNAVTTIRQAQGWHFKKGFRPLLESAGQLTVTGLARRLGVDYPWVYRRLRNGTIAARYVTRDLQTHRYLIQDDPELITRLQTLVRKQLKG